MRRAMWRVFTSLVRVMVECAGPPKQKRRYEFRSAVPILAVPLNVAA
jgi:hypothetical protein